MNSTPRNLTQAEQVLARIAGARPNGAPVPGAARKVAKLLGYNPSTVYRWSYPRYKGGAGGVIPKAAWPDLHKAARLKGVVLEGVL